MDSRDAGTVDVVQPPLELSQLFTENPLGQLDAANNLMLARKPA